LNGIGAPTDQGG